MSDAEMHVIKRNNKIEEISFDKILQSILDHRHRYQLQEPFR